MNLFCYNIELSSEISSALTVRQAGESHDMLKVPVCLVEQCRLIHFPSIAREVTCHSLVA